MPAARAVCETKTGTHGASANNEEACRNRRRVSMAHSPAKSSQLSFGRGQQCRNHCRTINSGKPRTHIVGRVSTEEEPVVKNQRRGPVAPHSIFVHQGGRVVRRWSAGAST